MSDVTSRANAFIKDGFLRVKGMSSKTSALICTELLEYQNQESISGAIVEIGVYEGRFFIALALSARDDEHCVAIDRFTWPDEHLHDRFLANCAQAGLDVSRVRTIRSPSVNLRPSDIQAAARQPVRFMHVDGGHSYDPVAHDLRLAKYLVMPGGIICTDDVLHPQFPELTIAVSDFLKSSPEFQIFAIIDRESYDASCKFLICRGDADAYKQRLKDAYPGNVRQQVAKFFGTEALIINPFK